jgi:hypothetical protein
VAAKSEQKEKEKDRRGPLKPWLVDAEIDHLR